MTKFCESLATVTCDDVTPEVPCINLINNINTDIAYYQYKSIFSDTDFAKLYAEKFITFKIDMVYITILFSNHKEYLDDRRLLKKIYKSALPNTNHRILNFNCNETSNRSLKSTLLDNQPINIINNIRVAGSYEFPRIQNFNILNIENIVELYKKEFNAQPNKTKLDKYFGMLVNCTNEDTENSK